MIVPRYWAEGRAQHREPGRQVTVRRFGWSDASPEDAQRMADERAHAALAALLAGEKLSKREHKVPYNGAQGVPIREEVIAVHGSSVITRNAYGARCLNTPDVLFADVDFGPSEGCFVHVFAVALLSAIAIGIVVHMPYVWYFFSILLAGMIAATATRPLQRAQAEVQGGHQAVVLRKLRRFISHHPEFRVRVYQTPAGLRLLVVHRTFDPREPIVKELFSAVHADPVYVRMCENQHCFRARVSPKPWRASISDHIKPRPGVWPIKPEHLPARASWVERYETAARNYASCRYLETLGSETVDPRAEAVRALHDELCQAESDLPLA